MCADHVSTFDAKEDRVIPEQSHLWWAGVSGLISLICMALVILIADFPYPNDNLNGRIYLDYFLPSHIAEWQLIFGIIAIAVGMLFFLLLLAMSYMVREGQLMFSTLVIITTATAYAAVVIVTAGIYMAMPMLARGYPSFGANPMDYTLVTALWDAINALWTTGGFFLGLSWIAISFANRRHPVVPRALGSWGAFVVAVLNLAGIVSFFVPTGPWSPGSWAYFLVQSGVTWLWIAIASVLFCKRAWLSRRKIAPCPDAIPGIG